MKPEKETRPQQNKADEDARGPNQSFYLEADTPEIKPR